jgi:hypothetical protein
VASLQRGKPAGPAGHAGCATCSEGRFAIGQPRHVPSARFRSAINDRHLRSRAQGRHRRQS